MLASTEVRHFEQVCTDLGRDFVPLLFADPLKILKVPRLSLGNSSAPSTDFRWPYVLGHCHVGKSIFSALTEGRRLSPKMSWYMAPFILPSIW